MAVLEGYEAGRELNLARPAKMSHVGSEQGLSRREDGCAWQAEEADAFGAEVAVSGSGYVEDVHEEVEVMADTLEREVFDDAEVEVGE